MLYWVVARVFILPSSPRPIRPLSFRTSAPRNPSIYRDFHTLVFCSSASSLKSIASALLQKERGYTPEKRNPGETFANRIPIAAPADTPISVARPDSATLLSLGAIQLN